MIRGPARRVMSNPPVLALKLKSPMKPVVVWFRQDLRLSDQRALAAAVATGAPVIPLYILDDISPQSWRMGGASRWWLDKSLSALGKSLEELGGRLILRSGEAVSVLTSIAHETSTAGVYTQAAYEPWASAVETRAHAALGLHGVALKRYPGAVLKRTESLRTKAGEPYKVYSPFWRALVASGPPAEPLPAPAKLSAPATWPKSEALSSWGLHPTKPDWSRGMAEVWTPGEAGAHQRLDTFLQSGIGDYHDDRNRPDRPGTSRLSPHLHFGEISPAQCWHAAVMRGDDGGGLGLETFLKELAWRDFAVHLLVHWPSLPEAPFKPAFARFPWASDAAALKAWQLGRTGYPIVDAGMRELWHTGYMHNRVRMIVASFLIKDLLIPWQSGQAWFWDTLLDADLASNAASWQWVAGCGADAAPYFRIFNPVTQGAKFDPEGSYVRRWVPELSKLPAATIHAPWQASALELKVAGVTLGVTYPHPIVDHAAARERALAALASLKSDA